MPTFFLKAEGLEALAGALQERRVVDRCHVVVRVGLVNDNRVVAVAVRDDKVGALPEVASASGPLDVADWGLWLVRDFNVKSARLGFNAGPLARRHDAAVGKDVVEVVRSGVKEVALRLPHAAKRSLKPSVSTAAALVAVAAVAVSVAVAVAVAVVAVAVAVAASDTAR